jgi:hypothetical protein
MPCSCSRYPPLELTRARINKRIKATKAILKPLVLLATHDAAKLKLLQCPRCAQQWQTGWEWNLGGTEYAYHVPAIEASEWLREPCLQTAAWMVYAAMMQPYYAKNTFEPSGKPCPVAQCPHQAIKFSGVCEPLQEFGMLPKRPRGRPFPPCSI